MAKTTEKTKTDKGEAARAEKAEKPRNIGFRGIELELPPKLAASVLPRFWRLRDDDAAGAMRLLESIIGAGNFDRVLDKMDEDGLTVDDEDGLTELGNLISDSLGAYGMTAGESEASESS